MSYVLIFAAMGATYLPSSFIHFDAQEVANAGIRIEVKNFNYELTVNEGPLFFEIDLREFNTCSVTGLGITVTDDAEVEIFGATISEFGDSKFPFRLSQNHLSTATIAVACESDPDEIGQVFLIKLGEVVQAPLQTSQ